MERDMSIEEYLAQGGVLTSPDNVPPRYRAELLLLLTSFVDSVLAGAAGFAELINSAPGLKERIASARMVMEMNENASKLLAVMAEFGIEADRYASLHHWSSRLARSADIGGKRINGWRSSTTRCAAGATPWCRPCCSAGPRCARSTT